MCFLRCRSCGGLHRNLAASGPCCCNGYLRVGHTPGIRAMGCNHRHDFEWHLGRLRVPRPSRAQKGSSSSICGGHEVISIQQKMSSFIASGGRDDLLGRGRRTWQARVQEHGWTSGINIASPIADKHEPLNILASAILST